MAADQGFGLDALRIGAPDAEGRDVLDVYARSANRYVIYRSAGRVVALLADDPLVQRDQRQLLASLAGLRSEIEGITNPWRQASRWWRVSELAARVDLVVATALSAALDGVPADGRSILRTLRDEVAGERASRARLYYLACTFGVAAMMLLVCLGALGVLELGFTAVSTGARAVWLGVAAGVLGAVYSTALGIEKRDVVDDRRRADNVADALIGISERAPRSPSPPSC